MDTRNLRDAFGKFTTGVTVITCETADGAPHGATVTAFTPISLDPPLVQVALTRTSKACTLLEDAPFAVNVLAADQLDVAMHFAGRPRPEPIPWQDGATVQVLGGTVATLSCKPWCTYDGGDHLLFLSEVVEIETSDEKPLVFYGSAFHGVGDRNVDTVWTFSADDPHSGWFDAATDFRPPVSNQT